MATQKKSDLTRRDSLPFRQSKLTYLLKDSIGGNSKMIMIANIWAESSHLEETISTLRFASRIAKVTSCPSRNQHMDESFLIKKYEREIRDLKAELAMHDTLTGRGRIAYEPYSPEQQYEQQLLAQKFLTNEMDDVNIESIRQVKELFYQFRNLYKTALADSKPVADAPGNDKGATLNAQKNVDDTKNDRNTKAGVGQEELVNGFGIGIAPNDPHPGQLQRSQPSDHTNFVKQVRRPAKEQKLDASQRIATKFANLSSKDFNEEEVFANGRLDKKVLFENFKESKGKALASEIKAMVEDISLSKAKFDIERDACEKLKLRIADIQETVRVKDQDGIRELEEDELEPLDSLKGLKKKYKANYENYIYFKKHIKEMERKLVAKKRELLEAFNQVLKKNFSIDLDFFEEEENLRNNAGTEDQMNSAEVLFEQTHQKFETLMRARRMERMHILRN